MFAATWSIAGPWKRKPGVRINDRIPLRRFVAFAAILLSLALLALGQAPNELLPGPKPRDIPARWKPWIGEYGGVHPLPTITTAYVVFEKDGYIFISERISRPDGAQYQSVEKFRIRGSSPATHGLSIDHSERELLLGDVIDPKVTPDFDARAQVLIIPVRPVPELRVEALAATPPVEKGPFLKPDLVELAPLDASIHLDIRYATSNDFLGIPVYSQARAFLQRPAAEALLRIRHKLKPLGYGLLIHDAYRPWYVTKIFWDATPPEGKIFVADPAQGSRHNRGCAVDLTLYDLATGKPIEMPGTYDEMSPRSFPDYPGGTSLQRWHRDLLRRAMESEGFTVYEAEWWHFDYKDWKEYAISNIPFEKIELGQAPASVH